MKKRSLLRILIIAITLLNFNSKDNSQGDFIKPIFNTKLKDKTKEALEYCKKNGLNTEFCFLVDMSIHSGKNRFFIYSFKNQSIINQGLCSHGCCDNPWGVDATKTNPTFSNVENSHCSSIGKYKIGKRGYSNWGIHVNYKLHGLEKTNSNAYSRFIVLHSWKMIPENELYPKGAPEGWGCPAVSNKLMKQIDALLKKKRKSALLWIYK